ncbi:hypothetical protein PV10_06562 [Exophiala mesophila]|uniref:SGNH hydrolase-type esterase domain-containing protein n=1 Tax=Exophiala mesophila TaxID=212818 RepID=A0A0D1WSF2_EXOME|nr:uncharacterized protein PV10_06562 [Exophiala mesophila]KIV92095.1 hypothetical protein PV10_06562 [Exophiala mesophila]
MSHSPSQSQSQSSPTSDEPIPYDPSTPKTYPQFLLFGDSITQGGSHVLQATLSDWYQRRLDVINRGFSGYTAPAAFETLRQFFPVVPPTPVSPRIQLMTVFFGANDACVPGTPQHVPLEEYVQNLKNIIEYPPLKMHGTKVILVVPPPVDEWQLGNGERTAVVTAQYADACRQLGQELGLPVLDLWTLFMSKAGWTPGQSGPLVGSKDAPKNPVLDSLLSDGLHFTAPGYQLVVDELIQLIQTQLPDFTPDKLPQIFPDWRFMMRSRP